MPENLHIPLHTVTPLWTGGADKSMDRVHETSLIGSLRWWYELFVRGVGGEVKDPSRSNFNKAEYDSHADQSQIQRLREAGLCDVSQVFGATGWKRRFRLIVDDHTKPRSIPRPIMAERENNQRGWYFPGYPKEGDLAVTIQSLQSDFKPELIGGLIQFLSDWAAIGAKNQLGMGVVNTDSRLDTNILFQQLIAVSGNRSYRNLPSLDNLFLATVRAETNHLQETFNLKYDLRNKFRSNTEAEQTKQIRHFIMGTVSGQRQASKIKMSLPDQNNVMRVWGWIPHEPARPYSPGWNRERIMTVIHQHLTQNYNCMNWLEMNTSRTCGSGPASITNKELFLKQLLGVES